MTDDLKARLRSQIGDDVQKIYDHEALFKAALARIEELEDAIERWRKLDREAATHVESVIVMRTGFTGDPPYVGWRGLGLALKEALDERDDLRARAEAAEAALRDAEAKALERAAKICDYHEQSWRTLLEMAGKDDQRTREAAAVNAQTVRLIGTEIRDLIPQPETPAR